MSSFSAQHKVESLEGAGERRISSGERRRPIGILPRLMLVVTLLISAEASSQPPATPKPWTAKTAVNSPLGGRNIKKGTKLQVTLGKERMLLEVKKGAAISVPLSNVLEVTYDNFAQFRVGLWRAIDNPASDLVSPFALGYPPGYALLNGMVIGAILGVAALNKSKDHFVNVVWREGGDVQEVVFELSKNKYEPFLNELSRVTQTKWKNLPQERDDFRKELEQHKKEGLSVNIDRKVLHGRAVLAPGPYQVVLLHRVENRGDLVFFEGKHVDIKKIRFAVPVETSNPAAQITASQVTYKQIDELVSDISDIQTPKATFHILVPPPASN